jgi:hypothetical protein
VSNLTFSQLEQLWVANGGSQTWAPTMAAVALVESGGNTGVINDDPNTGDYSVGLWQINYYGDLYNGRAQEFGTPANLQADPNAQARAAVSLLGNGAGITNWEGDPVGKYVIGNNGGQPLTPQQAAYYAQLSGEGGTGGLPTTAAGVAGVGAEAQEGPRWLGLLNPGRCVFPPGGWTLPGLLGGSQICFVDAQAARKIKGYTAVAIGGGGLLLGIVLVVAIGFKRGAKTEAGSTALQIGSRVPGPVGTASRGARSFAGGGRGRRTTGASSGAGGAARRGRVAAQSTDEAAYEQGRRQAIRRTARESEYARMTGAQRQRNERARQTRERAEGFPGY